MKRFPVQIRRVPLGLVLTALVFCLFPLITAAQDRPPSVSQPQVGQAGKDVVWVPTPDRLIVRMLQMADTTNPDLVVDLGSGDGRIPIAAARQFGARGLGVEFDPDLIQLSIAAAARQGVGGRVRFVRQDLFQADLSEATVIALYLSPAIMLDLRPRLLALKPGTRIVSHQFTLGDWEPDEQAVAEGRSAYLWIVPARVEGSWRLSLAGTDYDVGLKQTHQLLRGTAQSGANPSPLFAARLRGETIRFAFIDANGDPRAFTGRVAGDTIEGTSSTHGRTDLAWSARRR